MAATENENKAKPGTMAEGMGVAKGSWFTELSTMWPGQGLSLKVDNILFQDRSKFQARSHCIDIGVRSAAGPEALTACACCWHPVCSALLSPRGAL